MANIFAAWPPWKGWLPTAIRWRFDLATNNRDLLLRGAQQLGLEIGKKDADLLLAYLRELLKWRRKVNLIARETPEQQIIENHFLDSLTLLPLVQGPGAHLLDVGTGAGFPGLVLACVLPEVQFTLVEPRQKRVSFLRHVVRTLGLTNTEVVADRLESYAQDWQGRFTHITSRAVAEPGLFLPLVRHLLTPQTRVLLMLAHDQSLAAIDSLDDGIWQIRARHQLTLPFSAAPRLLAVVGLT
ncbi:MAG: 16S rRNA (guanine(527)-N(7))-methyltransferase RsmG [Desulfobulbus sp.]|nr:16S rRNA (guanine(527)-N(7))-methyltransferase RsmG [Desulfobulbus sp.]